MLIYFVDLGYLNDNSYTHPLPLNAAVISSFVLKHMSDIKIRLFKHPETLIDTISKVAPDVLAMTHYGWNANLNSAIATHCKNYHPEITIIMGGPNFNNDDTDWMKWFFSKRPFLDGYIIGEGELSFLRIVQVLRDCDLNLTKSDRSKWPSTFYRFDHERKEIINVPGNPVDRLDLPKVPSPYLNGVMDEFLDDEHLSPIIETNRGCPYSCTYCVWGQATHSKVRQFDIEQIKEEIHYICARTKDPTKVLYVADANFGILKRDVEIAQTIMECREAYGFPERLYIYSTKDQTPHSIEAFEIISPIANMSMSLQSFNSDTLEYIGRNNINFKRYKKNYLECEKRGIKTYCEMIYGLPSESFESFVEGINQVLRSGQERVQLYAHILNWGAESASKEYRKKHGLKTSYRYQVKDAFGTYHGISTIEYEEIVTRTNDMSFRDFFSIRELHFFILLLGSNVFKELQHALKNTDYNIAIIAKYILENEKSWPDSLTQIMRGFRHACREELIAEKDLKSHFTEKDIDDLRNREVALVPSFICKLFARRSKIDGFKTYLENTLRSLISKTLALDIVEEIMEALCISMDKAVCYDDLKNNIKVEYSYDLESWLSAKNPERLKNFKKDHPVSYRLKYHKGLEDAFEKAKAHSHSLEHAVYLLKFKYYPMSDDRIFYYQREALTEV